MGVDGSMDFQRFIEIIYGNDLIELLMRDSERKVKRDVHTKICVFLTALSTYTGKPLNLFLKGESGLGKSYNAVQMTRYFPKEDVWLLGYLSPKSLIHDYGELCDEYGNPIDLNLKPIKPKKSDFESKEAYEEALMQYKEQIQEWKERLQNSYWLIRLWNKILVFLEVPEKDTFKRLLPILSHDSEKISYKFVDKTEKGQLRTARVVIEGFPATIFLTTSRRYLEELSTRSLTVTPEFSSEKFREANELANLKASAPFEFEYETEEFHALSMLVRIIKALMQSRNMDVIIPFLNLHEIFPCEIARDMRDFNHFLELIRAITIFNILKRPLVEINGKWYVLSSVKDVEKALEIFQRIWETTRTGTEEKALNFYHEIVVKKDKWYLSELTTEYNKTHKKKLSSRRIAEIMKTLSEIGYVDIAKDEVDKRLNVYIPLVKEDTEKLRIPAISETAISLSSKLEEGFKKWLEKYCGSHVFGIIHLISETQWEILHISLEEASNIVLGKKELKPHKEKIDIVSVTPLPQYFSEEDLSFKSENKHENTAISETAIISNLSENQSQNQKISSELLRFPKSQHLHNNLNGLLQCDICARNGKHMFFGSQYDLELHKMRVHGVGNA